MKNILILFAMLPTVAFSQKISEPGKYFENVSSLERHQYLDVANTIDQDFKPNPSSDVLLELQSTCGFEYKRDVNGKPIIPIVECEYKPASIDNPLDGITAKFNCDFKNEKGKLKKHKVKYSLKEVDQKEIPQAILTASLMRLLGFYADTYCPAIIKCKGCSIDPWSHRSQNPAIVGSIVDFKNAVVEFKVKGEKISVPRTSSNKKPLGFEWDELKRTTKNLNAADKKILLVERETLMLFNNFVYHTDADPHNNRLVCRKWVENTPSFRCIDVVAYTHDVGDSFKKMDFNFYKNYQPLSAGAFFASSCQGNLDRGEGSIVKAQYSDESRNLFLNRFDTVSDQQLMDLLDLSQVKKMGVDSQAWIDVFRRHTNSMRSIKCPSFETGKSVLGK